MSEQQELDSGSLSKILNKPVKFFMMDGYMVIFFLSIFIFQNLISVIITGVAITISMLLRNNGYPASMMLRIILRKLTGNKKKRNIPKKRRDHSFTN